MLDYIDQKEMSINNKVFPFNEEVVDFSNFDIDQQRNALLFAKNIVKVLDILGSSKDFSLNDMTNGIIKDFQCLISSFILKEPIHSSEHGLGGICRFHFHDINFILYVVESKDSPGDYYIYDFFKKEIPIVCMSENETQAQISQFALLKVDDLINADNIIYEELLPSFQKYEQTSLTLERVNLFMLDLISA